MRTCVSCGDPIPEDKRKDARYCGQSKCRGREYRKRHPKPATRPEPHDHQASAVLACPCGRRFLLTMTELHGNEATAAQPATPAVHAAFTQTDERTGSSNEAPIHQATGAFTQTAPQTDPPASTPAHHPAATDPTLAAITQTVLLTERDGSSLASTGIGQTAKAAKAPEVAAPKPAVTEIEAEAVTFAVSATSQPTAMAMTTLELSFCDATGRTLGFRDAVTRNTAGEWSLRPGARTVLRGQQGDPRCLGGTPGRWNQYYAGRSPTQFGFDADLAVMYWDARERRGKAASAKVVQGILGEDWKDKLRQIRDERLRAATG